MNYKIVYCLLFIFLINMVTANVIISETRTDLDGVVINIPTSTSNVTSTSSSNISSFTDLTDTPADYTGDGGNCVAVNGAEDGLEFIACSSTGVEGGDFNSTEFQSAFNTNITDWEERVNSSYLSTYNVTYAIWAYNQTTATYNQYGQWWYNQTSGASGGDFNSTEFKDAFNSNYSNIVVNTFNSTYDIWAYNQTTESDSNTNWEINTTVLQNESGKLGIVDSFFQGIYLQIKNLFTEDNNNTIVDLGINAGFNDSVDGVFDYNMTTVDSIYNYNQTNTLFFYNMTSTNHLVYEYNQTTVDSIYNYNQTDTIFFYNMSDGVGGENIAGSDFNSTEFQSAFNNNYSNIVVNTFNSTYDIWAYNMTVNSVFDYNMTTVDSIYNYNQTDTYLFYNMTDPIWNYNQTDTIFFYNMTDPVWNYNMTDTIFFYNMSDGSSLWTENGDDIYYDTGNVGIGTDSPDRTLEVVGILRTTKSGGAAGDGYIENIAGNSAVSRYRFGDTDDPDVSEINYDHSDDSMNFFTNAGSNAMTIDSSGKVGIGDTTPDFYLDIEGTNPTLGLTDTNGADFDIYTDSSIVYQRSSSAFKFRVSGNNDAMYLQSDKDAIFYGKLGIGGIDPTHALTVDGDFIMNGTGASEEYGATIIGEDGINGVSGGDLLLSAGGTDGTTGEVGGDVIITSGDAMTGNQGKIELRVAEGFGTNHLYLTVGNSTDSDGGDIIATPGFSDIAGSSGEFKIDGVLSMTGVNSDRYITFGSSGETNPDSVDGWKIVTYGTAGDSVSYGIGIEGGTQWFKSNSDFKFYTEKEASTVSVLLYDRSDEQWEFGDKITGASCNVAKEVTFNFEESGGLDSSRYEWSWGNGDENLGMPMPCSGEITGMGVMCETCSGTTSTVEMRIDTTGTDCETDIDTAGGTAGSDYYGYDNDCSDTFSAGDILRPYTIDDAGSCEGCAGWVSIQYG